MRQPKSDRIAELEDELKQRDAHIKELRTDLNKAEQLIGEMREQVEDTNALVEAWIECFDMVLNDDGKWTTAEWIKDCEAYHDRYVELLKQWNKFVPRYNAAILQRNVGRPLAASEAQAERVRKLHKQGMSLRGIVEETSLGLRTVRTIVDQGDGRDRTTIKHLERIDPDRKLEASWRARQRTRDALPKRITETLTKGRELVKEARGLKR